MFRFVSGMMVFLAFAFVVVYLRDSYLESEKVETEAQAIEIARKSWTNIYEKSQHSIFSPVETQRFEPYKAILENDKWMVTGTVPNNYGGELLITEITRDGRVLVSTVLIK
jgi:hypothetical protein